MTTEERACTALARLLVYPDSEYCGQLDEAIGAVRRESPEAAEHLAELAAALGPLSPEDREELFTRTFDVKPPTAMEIGWHLFGEDYHRGALMVRLRSELRRHGVEESSELPDHLTHVLALVDRMAEDEAEAFALACVIPAVDKILEGFRKQENPYEHLLQAVAAVLGTRWTRSQALPGNAVHRGSASPPAEEQATSCARCGGKSSCTSIVMEKPAERAEPANQCVPRQSLGTRE